MVAVRMDTVVTVWCGVKHNKQVGENKKSSLTRRIRTTIEEFPYSCSSQADIEKMMMSKAKVACQKKVPPDYEMQRMESLKQNADLMHGLGHGALANKIYQEKLQMQLQALRDAGLYSDEDEDDPEYVAEEEGDDNEVEICNSVDSNMKVSKHPKKALIRPLQQSMQSSTKSGTMAEYLQNYKKLHVHPSTESGSNEKVVDQHECASDHMCEKQNQLQQPVVERVMLPVSSQPQRKQHVKKKYCSPGALSAYRELQKKRLSNVIGYSDVERNVVALEPELNCTNAIEEGFESELQQSGSERLTMIEGEPSAQELEIQPTTEILTEAHKKKKTRGPTKMAKVHARTLEERQIIVLNKFGQPVGPTEEVFNEFLRFLGTLAKDSECAPLNFVSWPALLRTREDKLWEYVLKKYMVPEEGKDWVI